MSTVEALASPCISVCSMDDSTGYCRGCYRTLTEISSWLLFTQAERAAVIAALVRRRLDEDQRNDS